MFKVFNMFENFTTVMSPSFDGDDSDRYSILDIKAMH